jgi:hypothetical protein
MLMNRRDFLAAESAGLTAQLVAAPAKTPNIDFIF